MPSYREAVLGSWVQSAPSVRGLAGELAVSPPISVRDLINRLDAVESITVQSDINTDDDAPINGHVEFQLASDGTYTFSGHMRATGFPSYHYGVQAWVKAKDGTVIAAQRVGDVYGTDTPGDRQDNWSQPGSNGAIKLSWASLRDDAQIGYTMHADIGGVLGTAWDVLTFAVKGIAANLFLGEVGWVLLIGSELADIGVRVGTPDILSGILVAGGVLLVLGPFGAIPAVIAGIVTAELVDVRHRAMTTEERTFADRVFMGQIDYDRVTLTNMSHDGVKFTIPSVDDSILVNLDMAYDDPMGYQDLSPNSDYTQPGSVFIHELTHAWQITNKSFIGMICGMSHNYGYHDGDGEDARLLPENISWTLRPWDDFNNEQQAHIVDDWYGAYVVQDPPKSKNYLKDGAGVPITDLDGQAATRDPAFHFITQNIRTGTT